MRLKLKNRYFLLRHGKTTQQKLKKGIIYPPIEKQGNIELLSESKEKLKKIAKKIKKEKIDLIYCSDILRTRQTAEIVSKELGIKKINLDKRLRDTNLGIFHNRCKKEFYKFVGYKNRKFSTKIPKGENWNDLEKRTKKFLKDIDKKYQNKRILVVGHGDPLWMLDGILRGLNQQQLLDEIFVKKNFIGFAEFRKIN